VLQSADIPNLIHLVLFIPEIGDGPKFQKWVTWPCTRLLKGQFIFCWLVVAMFHLLTNFEMSSLKYIGPFGRTEAQTNRSTSVMTKKQ